MGGIPNWALCGSLSQALTPSSDLMGMPLFGGSLGIPSFGMENAMSCCSSDFLFWPTLSEGLQSLASFERMALLDPLVNGGTEYLFIKVPLS